MNKSDDQVSGVDLPAAERLEDGAPRRQRQFNAIYELKEFTGLTVSELKKLPANLLCDLSEEHGDPRGCVLATYAPTWQDVPLDREKLSYSVNGVTVFAGTITIIRALLLDEHEMFETLMDEAWEQAAG